MKIRIVFFAALAALSFRAEAATAVAVNVNGGKASALRQGAEAAGLDLEFESMVDLSHPPDVLVLQADEKGTTLSSNDVAAITKLLENGGALLLTKSKWPGEDMRRLAKVSPVAAHWSGASKPLPGIGSTDPDVSFFPSGTTAIHVPFRHAMRPFDRSAGSEQRPLLNREWKTRLFANNEARDSLLVTGRYGAGRVAVFASCAESGSEMFWKDVFTFLAAKPPQSPKPIAGIVSISAEGRKGEIAVTVANGEASPLKLPVLARVFSWNGEHDDNDSRLGEYVDDFSSSFTFPAGATATARLAIPDLGRFRPQSLEKLRLCKVRVGVFSPDGSELLREELLDLDGSRSITVDLRAPKDECVFRPSEKVKFTASARNGSSKEIKLDFDIAIKPFNAEETVLEERLDDSIPPGKEVSRDFEIETPKLRGGEKFGAGRIEILFKGKTVSYVPYIVREEDKAASADANGKGRNSAAICLDLNTFVADGVSSHTCYPTLDNLMNEYFIFAYSRQLASSPMYDASDPSRLFLAGQSFLNDGDLWALAPSGDSLMDAARDGFLATLRREVQKDTDAVMYNAGWAGWTGPSTDLVFSWQEIVEFDRHLRANGVRGLQGRTLRELKEEIAQIHIHPFLKWKCETYLANLRLLQKEAKALGKKAELTGLIYPPLLPPDAASEIAAYTEMSRVRTSRDLARGMAHKALNPGWRLFGWAEIYVNRTVEAFRRHTMMEAWRTVAENGSRFVPLYSYEPHSCEPRHAGNDDDKKALEEEEIAERRVSAIRPDGPIGMGLCLGTAVIADENKFVFSGGDPFEDSLANRLLKRSALIMSEMENRRVGVPFAANASALSSMPPTMHEPLLVPLPDTFSADERAFVATWAKSRGMIVFVTDGKAIAPEFAELFGGAEPQHGNDAVSLSKYGVIIDRELEKITQEDFDLVAKLVRENFKLGTLLPEGTTGYGFTSNRRRFAVVADMCDEGRDVTVKIRAGYGKTAVAMEFNEHRRLDVVRDGEYWSVTLPLKRGDANLIMIEEK